jgi:hypothetical protein
MFSSYLCPVGTLPFETMDLKRETEQLIQFLDLARAEAVMVDSDAKRNRGASANESGVEIRIVAGEATHEEYSQAYDGFKGFLENSFARIKMVVGPVVSGDYLGRCSLFDLAKEYPERFLLFIPYERQNSHWKLLRTREEPRFLQIEADHNEPIALNKTCEKILLSSPGIVSANGSIAPDPELSRTFFRLAGTTLKAFDELTVFGADQYHPDSPDQPPVRTTQEITGGFCQSSPSVERCVMVDCPRSCRIHCTTSLDIQLWVRSDHSPIEIYDPLAGAPSLLVHLASSGFVIARPTSLMRVPFDRPSEKVRFELVPCTLGNHEIEIQLFYESRRIGYLAVKVQVLR